jgi:hypothetical protein
MLRQPQPRGSEFLLVMKLADGFDIAQGVLQSQYAQFLTNRSATSVLWMHRLIISESVNAKIPMTSIFVDILREVL